MDFRFKAIDSQGNIEKGYIKANTEKEVVSYLYEKDLKPIKITNRKSFLLNKSRTLFTLNQWSAICRQMGLLLNSGMDLIVVLETLSKQWKRKDQNLFFTQLCKSLYMGNSLFQTLNQYENIPGVLKQTLFVGENSANLSQVFINLGAYFEREAKYAKKIKSIMIYPSILLFITVSMVCFLTNYTLPVFEKIYLDNGILLPQITTTLLSVTNFFKKNFIGVILGFGFFIFILFSLLKNDKIQSCWHSIIFKIPLIGLLNINRQTQFFTEYVKLLYSSGMDIMNAIYALEMTSNNLRIKKGIKKVRKKMNEGIEMSIALEEENIYPLILISFLKVGEQSSSLEEALKYANTYYTGEYENYLDKFSRVIEPVMTIIMSVFVGFIVLAISIPMFDMVNF